VFLGRYGTIKIVLLLLLLLLPTKRQHISINMANNVGQWITANLEAKENV